MNSETTRKSEIENDISLETVTCEGCGHQVPPSNMTIHKATICGRHRSQNNHIHNNIVPHEHDHEPIQFSGTTEISSSPSPAVATYPLSYSSQRLDDDDNDDDICLPPKSKARFNTNTAFKGKQEEGVEYDDDDSEVEVVNHQLTEVVNLADDDDDDDEDDDDDDDDIIVEEWACPLCTLTNPIESRYCDACGKQRFNHHEQSESTDGNVRRPDPIRTERLIPLTELHNYHEINQNNDEDNNHLMRDVGSSALLGSAIGAFAGYARDRNILNSALEGAVAGALGGALSNHINSSLPLPPSSSSRRYLNVYSSRPSSLGFSYRTTGHSSTFGNQIPLEVLRMMASTTARGENIDNMDYERLLEVFGDGSENKGASATTIQNLPSSIIQDVEKDLPKDFRKCAICLEEFKNGQNRKVLECLHGFHDFCIDRWLGTNASCPICKFHVGR